MAQPLRKAPGMRERSPGVWELVVQSGIDPVTGKRRQTSRVPDREPRFCQRIMGQMRAELGQRQTPRPARKWRSA